MPRKSWDQHWYERALHNAEMSTCAARKVGGVLVRDNRVIADGMNGTLSGHLHCDEDGCDVCNDPHRVSGEKLERCVCCHCEQNIISFCAKNGILTDYTSIYLPCSPCLDCAKLLISSGIREIVYQEPYGATHSAVKELCIKSAVILRKYKLD